MIRMAKPLKKQYQSVKVPTGRNTSVSGLNCTQSFCKFQNEAWWQPFHLLTSKQRRQSLLNPTWDLSCLGELEGLKDGRSAAGKLGCLLAARRLLNFSVESYFQETHWNEPWTRTGLLPGEHLRVRHTALIFPPSTISNGHREPCTSEKALHWQACLKQEALQPLASNHLNDPCMPRPWLTTLAEKKIHQHLWLRQLFHPQCRRHRKTATNKQH